MSVNVRLVNREGKASLENHAREYNWNFRAISTARAETEANVINAVLSFMSISIGGVHPTDSAAYLNDVSVRQRPAEDYSFEWTAVATFSTHTVTPSSQADDPTSLAAITDLPWSIDFVIVEEAVEKDLDGFTVMNSAGRPFPNPCVLNHACPQFKIKVNVPYASLNIASASTWLKAVNDATWHGYAAGFVRIDGFAANPKTTRAVYFWEVDMTLTVNYRSWNARLLDQGYEYLTDDGQLRKFRDGSGQVCSSPQLLNGSGGKLPDGDTPAYLTFRTHNAVSFSALGI